MAFQIEITPRALLDLDRIYARIARSLPNDLTPWVLHFEQSILSLSEFPERCQIEANMSSQRRTVRKLLVGRRNHVYSLYFTVIDEVVKVLHVRHGARKEPKRL